MREQGVSFGKTILEGSISAIGDDLVLLSFFNEVLFLFMLNDMHYSLLLEDKQFYFYGHQNDRE